MEYKNGIEIAGCKTDMQQEDNKMDWPWEVLLDAIKPDKVMGDKHEILQTDESEQSSAEIIAVMKSHLLLDEVNTIQNDKHFDHLQNQKNETY